MNKLNALFLIVFLAFNTPLFSQENKSQSKAAVSIEIDPVTFPLKGYSIHLRFQPKNAEHLLVGFGTYAMNMPDALINFNQNNSNQGWKVRINQGYGLFGEYYFNQVNHKWFVGTQLGIQQFKIEKTDLVGHEKFTNLLAMGYFGYSIKPFANNLYFKPWAGIGYTSKLTGSNTLDNATYSIAPITSFLTLHIGYTF